VIDKALPRAWLSGVIGLCFSGAAIAAPAKRCVCPCPAADGAALAPLSGLLPAVPAPPPAPAAFALNRAGRDLYRQRRWEDARQSYRAALAADPAFLAPRLNIACSFVQDDRFDAAVAEARTLLGAGFVPWAREIEEAADLAPLRARPEHASLRAAMAPAGRAWGEPLLGALLFVARTGPAVNLPAEGTLVLSLAQEIFGYLPASGAYRQVTAEDGRVLGFVRSADGRTVAFVRAGKLVRVAGQAPFLRGLSVRRLDLVGMVLGPPVALPGDIARLVLAEAPAGAWVELSRPGLATPTRWLFDGRALLAVPDGQGGWSGAQGRTARILLDGSGVERPPAARETRVEAPASVPCRFSARDADADGVAVVEIVGPGPARFTLKAPHGAALGGLRFPGAATTGPPAAKHQAGKQSR
jgi:hypothetical protein